MPRVARAILFSWMVTAVVGGVACAQTRVYAKVDLSTDVYPGDTFIYSIVIDPPVEPENVDVSPLAEYSPTARGSRRLVEFVNGKTRGTYALTYAITAVRPGPMRLDPVTVTIAGKKYTTNPVEVSVSRPGTTDKLKIVLEVSQKRCYVGQPILMTVQWQIMAPVRDAAFDVPVFRSGDFYIENAPEDGRAYAREQHMIHSVPVVLTETRRSVQGVETAVISFSKILIPKQSGKIVLEPVTVSAKIAVGRVRTRDLFNPYITKYERFAVSSDPVELDVLALPQQAKPPGFYGLVGRYTISASATPTKVNVGDPITLTIRIGGNQYLKPVQWPALEQVAELAANFRIPTDKASPVVEGGVKIFTQTIRATNDRVQAIPPIPLAYFDTEKGRYEVAATEPIPIEVAGTRILTDADVEGGGGAVINREVEAIKQGLSANYDGLDVLVDQKFSVLATVLSPGYAVIWLAPLLAFAGSAGYRLLTRTSPERAAQKQRRSACRRAVRQLREVSSAEPNRRAEALASIMRQYVGDRFDRSAGSLTAEECRDLIEQAIGDRQAAQAYADVIAACEAGQYAPVRTSVEVEQIEQVIELVQSINSKANR